MFSILSFDTAGPKFHHSLKAPSFENQCGNNYIMKKKKKLLSETFYLFFTVMGAGGWVISAEYASVRKYLDVN